MLGDALLGAAIAFLIATLTAPVGISGAVFLVPVQLSVLNTPSAAVTPTNLLYNLIAIPGALFRYRRTGNIVGPLARFLVLGSLPGVVVGAVIRVELLSGPDAFLLVVAAVLVPLGVWLALLPPPRRRVAGATPNLSRPLLAFAFVVGIIGGVYGIGGGSILAPVLLGLGFAAVEVAPAALVATFLTSIAGVATFGALSLQGDGSAPDWIVGLSLGLGGLAGSYLGAALQPRLPEARLRRLAGVLAVAIGLRYLLMAAG
jgi:uncharacterized membrane protein YfcA